MMNEFSNLTDAELDRMQSDMLRSAMRVVDMVVEFVEDSSKPNPFVSPDGKSAPASQAFLVKFGLLRNVRAESLARGMEAAEVDKLLNLAVTES